MPSETHSDLHRELKSTKTVRGSVETLVNSIWQRLDAALKSDTGSAMNALRELHHDLAPAHRDWLADGILHGTPSAKEGADVDPDAPPRGSNCGSTGTNVYGSKGPDDTDTNRNSSLGYAGADMKTNAAVEDHQASRAISSETDQHSRQASDTERKPAADGAPGYPDRCVEHDGKAPAAGIPATEKQPPIDNEHVALGATRFSEEDIAHNRQRSATEAGPGAVQQDKPAGEADHSAEKSAEQREAAERKHEPA